MSKDKNDETEPDKIHADSMGGANPSKVLAFKIPMEDGKLSDSYALALPQLARKFETSIEQAVYKSILDLAQEIDPKLTFNDFMLGFVDGNKLEFSSSQVLTKLVDGIPKTLANILEIRDALSREVERRKKPDKQKRERPKLPNQLPQPTFQEAKNMGMAIAHGPTAQNWAPIKGEVAFRYSIEGEPIEVKLTAGNNLNRWDAPITHDNLTSVLQTLGTEATFLFEILLSYVCQNTHTVVEMDSLIKLIGWDWRTATQREAYRRQIFHWLCVYDNLWAIGKRSGTYKDQLTGKVHDLTINSKLLTISELHYAEAADFENGRELPQQRLLDGSEPPTKVTLTAGPWLERFRENGKVLQYIGDILKLAGLPTGQAHGEWALSIGMALNQLWRERASRAEVKRVGEDKHDSVIYSRPFTRVELLGMFPPVKFAVEEILKSSNPQRARAHWDKAIKELTGKKVISEYKQINKRDLPRKGWQDTWYKHETFDIRPGGDTRKAAIEISKTATAKRRNATRRKPATE